MTDLRRHKAHDEMIGYVSPFITRPGDHVNLMVSCGDASFSAKLVRLIHGDTNSLGPGYREEFVQSLGDFPGELQRGGGGSFVYIPSLPDITGFEVLTLQAWIYPTLLEDSRAQCVMRVCFEGGEAVGLYLDRDGAATLRVDQGSHVGFARLDCSLELRRWRLLTGSWNRGSGEAVLSATSNERWPGLRNREARAEISAEAPWTGAALALIGASGYRPRPDDSVGIAIDPYNGKIDAPRLSTRVPVESDRSISHHDPGIVAAWDFSEAIEGTDAVDRGPHAVHGRIINSPTRGVTGHDWRDGTTLTHGRKGFGAIHFHEDDLDDIGWRSCHSFAIPAGARSGYYAVEVRSSRGVLDRIPFLVTAAGGGGDADICLLAPTLTYLAYANYRFDPDNNADVRRGLFGRSLTDEPGIELINSHPEWGLSLYDVHRDGSGVVYSTSLRPLVDLRPTHRNPFTNSPRHLGADLYLVDWMEHVGYSYELVTDHDLNEHGESLLSSYRVVLTGTHPEYWTAAMLDALEAFLAAGGRLMYLGGNGFYWVTSIATNRDHIIEVRRGQQGSRPWDSSPGEIHHSTTGEHGGTWNWRGRSPHRLVGIGFAGQGYDYATPGYERLVSDEIPGFIFAGVADLSFGDSGLAMEGGAGDEIDRMDADKGTPQETILLAQSTGHGPHYWQAVEDVRTTGPGLSGDKNSAVRSDIVYLAGAEGGRVFAVGSICWGGTLSQEAYDGPTSRIMRNVIDAFRGEDV
ncbi:MAG: hypothetical protein DCC49_10725 [Acidobacteria bacterium]|nr:MAG: hypothetical protein DCC49_10725 [Acidobacteriota bacterium]